MTLPHTTNQSDLSARRALVRTHRRRRIRHVIAVVALLLVAVLSEIYLQNLSAKTKFMNAVSLRHSRGEPILAEDFHWPEVASEENAASCLTRAAKTLKMPTWEEQDAAKSALIRRNALTPANRAILEQLIAQNGATFKEARKARELPIANWNLRLKTPVLDTLLIPYLSQQYELTEGLRLAALYEHRIGNDAASIERIREIMGIARAVDQQCNATSHLMSIGFLKVAAQICILIAPDVNVSAKSSSVETGPASTHEVQGLIEELLDDAPYRAGLKQAWLFERMEFQDKLAASVGEASFTRKAALYRDIVFVMDLFDEISAASDATNYMAAKQEFPKPRLRNSPIDHLTPGLLSNYERMITLDYEARTDRRVAAVALAMRLYAIQHEGYWPTQLVDLTPEYLQHVPIDPFSPNGKTLGYLPGETPRLYSVGEDGIDGHGDQTRLRPEYRWGEADAVFQLGGDQNEGSEKN